MKTLFFLFSNGSYFNLTLPERITEKTVAAQLVKFQKLLLEMEEEHKRFASGKTKFKLPVSRPVKIGIREGDNITPLYDEAGGCAIFKGFSLLEKHYEGSVPTFNREGAQKLDEEGRPIMKKTYSLSTCPFFAKALARRVVGQIGTTPQTLPPSLPEAFQETFTAIEERNAARLAAGAAKEATATEDVMA